ncbi:BREX-1 system adenine-specific DNA-methyltransferase PglX [Desemzia sp. C1]|uniref:BREX-1 system adenine-specific DNA-methyltransferase PglX n=1 Tax=Desemzia sp. C1 TaxID=2892016 RepID=UPI001E2A1182|nr:BREX-1 system adenine-specific DNA-methyltransferase PglX [Desemzia sp. C1]MCI3028211.1 BREX-1 system adenine-specific DNA-methyltransferase PglX [Desemzia sp. C1]
MDKTALRKFAVQSRKKLVDAVKQKAYTFGITEKGTTSIQELQDGLIINGTVLGETELKQYTHLKNRIVSEGYNAVMEEAAYTWFNRFVALRYMEVNDFLPIHMRILSSEQPGKTEPDALTNVLELAEELNLDRERIYQLQDDNKTNNLYQYLLVKQSNKLGEIIPNVFEPISDDIALLLPDYLLNENSIIRDIVTMIDEEDWKNVEIVGWLYQFYISEQKDEVFSNLKKNKKIGKEDIGPATQLFTPRWIVEYMVDNSLGRLWLESHPDEDLQASLEYYLEDAEQTEEVKAELDRLKDPNLDVEAIKFLDPSCGSGHILVYAFDLFYKLYLSRGYLEREIPQLILENNLYGLDIDKRAAQLATFAVVMKAREYDRRLFSREYTVHVHSIEESNSITQEDIHLFARENEEIKEAAGILIETFDDAKLYGSIIQVPEINVDSIEKQMAFIRNEADLDIFTTELVEYTFPLLEDLIHQYRILASQYEVVVTNPPYMGQKGMDPKLSKYVKKFYPEEKSDLFAVFMEVTRNLTKENHFTATINQHAWMFISSFEKVRIKLFESMTIINMLHLGTRTFEEIGGEVVQNTSFVVRNIPLLNYNALYMRMTDIKNAEKKKNAFHQVTLRYKARQGNFSKIPGSPIAYWASEKVVEAFSKENKIENVGSARVGLQTGDNDKFLRFWHEVSYHNIAQTSLENEVNKKENYSYKWYPYKKGGSFRKWYGNDEYIVNWEDGGIEIRNFKDSKGKLRSRPQNIGYYFREHLAWSDVTSGKFSARYTPPGYIFDSSGPGLFFEQKYKWQLTAYINSNVFDYFSNFTMSTIHFNSGVVSKQPFIYADILDESLPKENIEISKSEWDDFENSWNFEYHPFIAYKDKKFCISESYSNWEKLSNNRFYRLKANEEELNRIFINIYGLQDELTPEIEDRDITVRKADKQRDIKSFLSYLVGLMFGRYSLDKKGLAYAGGEWDSSVYTQYQPDADNILTVTEESIFEDDIVRKVEELVALIYSEETLEENLLFIAEALNKKDNESSRERIRRYFRKEFYKDHLQIYQKRPIYWQFSSGKRGAFQGLMYLHRYNRDTIARLRTDYVLKESKVIDNLITLEQHVMDDESSSKSQKAQAQKAVENYLKDKEEIVQYAELLDHVAKQRIELDLDDGVKVNYEKFQNIEAVQDKTGKVVKRNIFEKLK